MRVFNQAQCACQLVLEVRSDKARKKHAGHEFRPFNICVKNICLTQMNSFTFRALMNSVPVLFPSLSAVGGGRGLQTRQRMLPQRRAPRPPRLPPLRPVTNLSFSRSFTFSFFELPLHQSPCCRAERIRNLMLLLRQIHY